MLSSILIIFALLTANALFVAAEFALVKAKAFRIDALADEGSKSARLTQRTSCRNGLNPGDKPRSLPGSQHSCLAITAATRTLKYA